MRFWVRCCPETTSPVLMADAALDARKLGRLVVHPPVAHPSAAAFARRRARNHALSACFPRLAGHDTPDPVADELVTCPRRLPTMLVMASCNSFVKAPRPGAAMRSFQPREPSVREDEVARTTCPPGQRRLALRTISHRGSWARRPPSSPLLLDGEPPLPSSIASRRSAAMRRVRSKIPGVLERVLRHAREGLECKAQSPRSSNTAALTFVD